MKKVFSFSNSVAGRTELMTKERFNSLMDDKFVVYRCDLLQKETDKDKRDVIKKGQPVILYNAAFPSGKRKDNEAVPSGMMMIDIDKPEKETPTQIFERIRERAINEFGLVVANISISGKGLRLVFPVPQGMAIAEGMAFYEKELNLPNVDHVCKDFARSSFAVKRDYYLYLDDDTLFGDKELKKVVGKIEKPIMVSDKKEEKKSISTPVKKEEESKQDSAQTETEKIYVEGICAKDIVDACEEQLGGKPAEGDRNNFYFRFACHLKHLYPDAETLLAIMPDYGLDEQERMSAIKSALAQPKEGMTNALKRAIEVARPVAEADDGSSLPKFPSDNLPQLIYILTQNVPNKLKPCVSNAVFPALGAYMFGTTFTQVDGTQKEPSFMHVTLAGQSSGKGGQNAVIFEIIDEIKRRDDEGRKDLEEYKKKAKKRSSQEALDDEPRPVIQYLPADITAAAFARCLDYADGRYLFQNFDESRMLEDLGMNGKKDIGKIICEAFNQQPWGQMRVGCESVSAFRPLRWNWSGQCTISMAKKIFDKYAGSGEISRINVSTVGGWDPDYHFGEYDEAWRAKLHPYIENLESHCGLGRVDCQEALDLAKECSEIFEEKYALTQNEFYRTWGPRAVVIAQSKAVLLWLANGMKWEDSIADFCKWSFEYDLACKWMFFGDAFETAMEKERVKPHRGKQNLLTNLPEVFTTEQAKQVRLDNKLSEDPRQMIANWTFRKYIELTEDGKYKKLPPQQKAS